jgi:hypothetical protein
LDDLGWYQFEMLIQSLLKTVCGLNVESWGNRQDFGRDAFCKHTLCFPEKSKNKGPFIFQVKFVENANAAGAEPEKALITAVNKERMAIQHRKNSPKWQDPKYFTLITNAPLLSDLRDKLMNILIKELPTTEIIIWGEGDVSDILDEQQTIRRSFPQLLSLRELDYLIENVLNKSIIERSQSAIDEARLVIPVFVPTSAYRNCWDKLSKYNFAVLDGPPEVGKTAIAWMIAITLVTRGWQAIICNKPDDFFQAYTSDILQVFIADDAFGRTEFDVTHSRDWERDLDKILNRLDKGHRLIWTSRKHILEKALHEMDLQGNVSHFPDPAEILVDAGKLSAEEKALILYRHAKAANLEKETKEIVKKNARMITNNSNFTPERIRRFVKEALPQLVTLFEEGKLTEQGISKEIDHAITRPTEMMKKSFEKLNEEHKLLLVSLLKSGNDPSLEDVERSYRAFCGNQSKINFGTLVDDLSESFIRLRTESKK